MKKLNYLISIVFLLIFQSTEPTLAAQKDDTYLIKEINKQLENIENSAVSDIKKLDKLLVTAFSSKNTSKKTANKNGELLEKLATKITNTLKLSMEVKTPDIKNEKAKTYIADAIDAHKHWSISQAGRLKSIFVANSEDFETFEKESKHYAEIEAYSLLLADKAIKKEMLPPR